MCMDYSGPGSCVRPLQVGFNLGRLRNIIPVLSFAVAGGDCPGDRLRLREATPPSSLSPGAATRGKGWNSNRLRVNTRADL